MERGGAVEEILTQNQTETQNQTQNQNQRRVRMAERQQPSPHPPPQKCPRCESLNTKFCYYNNYSLAQPRYFCKGCRRYWTHGGTLRNVPVGGGCRKGKRPRTEDARGFTHAVPATNFSAARAPAAIGGAIYGGGRGLGFFPSAGVNENFQLGANLPTHHHCPGQNDFYLTQQNFPFPATARPLNSWTQSFVARNAAMAGSSSTPSSGFWTSGENPGVGYSFNPNQWPGFDPSA